MKLVKIEIVQPDGLSTGQAFAKLIVSSTAGFVASNLAQKLFMKVIERRQDIITAIQN